MKLIEKEFDLQVESIDHFFEGAFHKLRTRCGSYIGCSQRPVRFVITSSFENELHCEMGVADWEGSVDVFPSIFDFRLRYREQTDAFNVVLVIPTGIGAELGGHAGDAGAVAKLIASACDTLITHPNVVNACDFNEIPDNALYVEGSVLTRFLMGVAALNRTRSNRILLVVDAETPWALVEKVVNIVGAARATMGIDCRVIELDPAYKAEMRETGSGRASGVVSNFENLMGCLKDQDGLYDALALVSEIKIPPEVEEKYFNTGDEAVNPWGGCEAMITHTASLAYNVPAAHAPILGSMKDVYKHWGVVDPRKAAEVESATFLYCLLKGLHKAPHVKNCSIGLPGVMSNYYDFTAEDVSCLIIPDGCMGLSVLAAMKQDIPVIVVQNRNWMRNDLHQWPFKPGKIFYVKNYLEAVGVMQALKAGVTVGSVTRPLLKTVVDHD